MRSFCYEKKVGPTNSSYTFACKINLNSNHMNNNVFQVVVIGVLLAGGIMYFVSQGLVGSTGEPIATSTVNAGPIVQTPTPNETPVPGKPVATTNATVAPADTTAVVTGTVSPNGSMTTYWYEYGTTNAFGKKTANQVVGSGYTAIPTPGYITGLVKNTTYFFQLVAENQYGRALGGVSSVKTTENTPAPVGGIPTASTVAASGITANAASIKGTVNPNKATTQYWFEYGTAGDLGNVTTFVSVGNGSATVDAGATVTGLRPGTTYFYRLNAQNQFGTVNGAILTFKTMGQPVAVPPVVTTQVPSLVAATTATVQGTVNGNSAETKYYFEYSTEADFRANATKVSMTKSIGAVSTTQSVQAVLSALRPNTVYHVRIVAENSGGIVRGDSQTFTTK
jgi:hypothetical protein